MSNKYTLKRKLTLKVVNTISVHTGRGYHLATNNTHTHTHTRALTWNLSYRGGTEKPKTTAAMEGSER